MVDIANVKWKQIKHFVDGKEIPGGPMALIPELGGWAIIMPNYWYGIVVVPENEKKDIESAMGTLSEIHWETTPLPIPEPDGTGEYGIPPGEWNPKSKRGFLPGGELIYINQQTTFVPNKA